MLNDDILLQKNAGVCTSAVDRNWTGDAVSSSGQSWEPHRSSGSCFVKLTIFDMHHYFLVGEVQHVMGPCLKERTAGGGVFLYFLSIESSCV